MHIQLKTTGREVIKNFLILVGGTFISQLITILLSPIISRLYNPKEFGIFSIYLSITSILIPVVSFRYPIAIVLPKKNNEANALFILTIILSVVVTTVLFIIFMFLLKAKLINIKITNISILLGLLFFNIVFSSTAESINMYSIRFKEFYLLSKALIIKVILDNLFKIVLGFFYNTGISLIISQFLSNIISIFYLIVKSVLKINIKQIFNVNFKKMNCVAKKYKNFPKYNVTSELLSIAAVNLPILLFSFSFDSTIIGNFGFATKILLLPITLIGQAISKIYYQSASLKVKSNNTICLFFKRVTGLLFLIGFPFFSILFIWSPQIFSFLFGSVWTDAGIYARLLTPWIFLSFCNPPSVMSYLILELQKERLIIDIFNFVLRIIAILIGSLVLKNINYTLIMISVLGVLYNMFLICFIYFKVKC